MTKFRTSLRNLFRLSAQFALLTSCTGACHHIVTEPDNKSVHIFIWAEYTSKALFEKFTQETGIEVVESNFSSNEELLAKLQTGADGYDLIIPSDYMINIMAKLDLIQPLDHHKIPNIKNIEADLLNLNFDLGNRFSLPYTYAVTGITYNKEVVQTPITGYQSLWTNDQLRLRFSVLDDSREVFASALKRAGHSASTLDLTELKAARDELIKGKPRVREFTSTPASLLESGDLLASQMYSNESLRLMSRDARFQFILPSEGYLVSMDNYAVTKSSKHRENAYALINFLLAPENNLVFATEIMTAPVTAGTREKLPDAIKNHPAIQPLSILLQRGEMLRDVNSKIHDYDRMWTELKVAGS
jgi:spermidine/putrescine transport system substrate-binding protein